MDDALFDAAPLRQWIAMCRAPGQTCRPPRRAEDDPEQFGNAGAGPDDTPVDRPAMAQSCACNHDIVFRHVPLASPRRPNRRRLLNLTCSARGVCGVLHAANVIFFTLDDCRETELSL